MTTKPTGPIRRGSVVLIDIPEDAPELAEWPDDLELPDGCGATVLRVDAIKGRAYARLYVGDDYGELDPLIPLDWLDHETEPFGEAERNGMVYRFEKMNEHEAAETEIVPHEDGLLVEEYINCKHCNAYLDFQRLNTQEGDALVYIAGDFLGGADKKCRLNPHHRGIVKKLRIG